MNDTHVQIPDYQAKFIEEYDLIFAHVVRDGIDDRMIREGCDPDEWKETYGV